MRSGNCLRHCTCNLTTQQSKLYNFYSSYSLKNKNCSKSIVNMARECKNRYLFTYLKSLVDCGTFQEIYLDFLPVGHTHCDIDQMFSRFSVYLKGLITRSEHNHHVIELMLNNMINCLSSFQIIRKKPFNFFLCMF